MSWNAAFYTAFWTAFRAAYPNLQTDSGWKRRPGDAHRNYLGHRIGHYDNVYVHAAFRGRGAHRRLCVTAYSADGTSAEWATAQARLTPSPAGTALTPDPNVQGQAGRLEHVVAAGLTPQSANANRQALFRSLASAYDAVSQSI